MKRQFHLVAVVLLFTALPFNKLFSNGLSISNVTPNQTLKTVTFDITWNNSWRNTSTTAANWDAAWVFVKWRFCSDLKTTPFTHGLVSTTVGDHVFAGSTVLEPTRQDGTLGIDPSPNNTGVILRNTTNPTSGNVTISATVTLSVTNLPASGNLDLKVYGIEMVFVPEGAFSIGDGQGPTGPDNYPSYYSFASSNNIDPARWIYSGVASENAQFVYETGVHGQRDCPNGGICPLTAQFPKGFNAFYIMKYEVSEKDYVSFLNAVPSQVQWSQYFSNAFNQYRYRIFYNSSTLSFETDRPDRGCNWLSWSDLATFLDWAALRPLTELQYEKACRGTEPAKYAEAAWGTRNINFATTISGTEDGTETITTPTNANICGYYPAHGAFSGGDGGEGPLRSGIFATATTSTREQTGGSFYGVMELSGNISEFYINVYAGLSGNPSQTGIDLGDGNLDISTPSVQHFDVVNWPSISAINSNSSRPNFIIRRGGSYYSSFSNPLNYNYEVTVSSRQADFQTSPYATFRDRENGGRGGR